MSVVIKGSRVALIMVDGSKYRLPPSHGIIHDPDGVQLERCVVYFDRVKKTQRTAKPDAKASRYFGRQYKQRAAEVNLPPGPWKELGRVHEILYWRPGIYQGRYYHFFFKKNPPTLSRCRGAYRLNLHGGCVVDDRGFVFP